jgi:transcriptional regulator with XRE-family HTH domain
MTTGAIIKSYRDRMNFSQEMVATYLGVKRELISYWENDSREIPLEHLEKLANLFGTPLSDFFATDEQELNLNLAFAFRADELCATDLTEIAQFQKVVRNYIKLVELSK